MHNKRLTLDEKILLVAVNLDEKDVTPFSAEDLVVAAWKAYPDSFALDGYPEFPDSNRVYSKIMGSKGLRGRGWLERAGEKQYQLTTTGRIAARNLAVLKRKGETVLRVTFSRENQNSLRRLLASRAFEKVQAEREATLIFSDACAFWGITPRSNAKTLTSRLADTETVLSLAEQQISSGGTFALTHQGESVDEVTVKRLRNTHEALLEEFNDELRIIRARTDER